MTHYTKNVSYLTLLFKNMKSFLVAFFLVFVGLEVGLMYYKTANFENSYHDEISSYWNTYTLYTRTMYNFRLSLAN